MKSKRVISVIIIACILTQSIGAAVKLSDKDNKLNYKNNLFESKKRNVPTTNNNLKRAHNETTANNIIDAENSVKNEGTLDLENNITYKDLVLNEWPNIQSFANYSSGIKVKDLDDKTVFDPIDSANYTISGNITSLEADSIKNSNADTNEGFYSNESQITGAEVERIKENNSDNYAWRYFSNDTTNDVMTIYKDTMDVFQENIEISFDYKLENMSSLQYKKRSLVAFDVVFDTCSVMIGVWYYDPDTPLQLENITDQFDVVFSFMQNTTWDNEWYNFHLNLSQVLNEYEIPKPKKIYGFIISARSEEQANASILIDNLHITSKPSPDEIHLAINNHPINSTMSPQFTFTTYINENDSYQIELTYSSSIEIVGNYSIEINGTIDVSYSENFSLASDGIQYNLVIYDMYEGINSVNVIYPHSWNIRAIYNITHISEKTLNSMTQVIISPIVNNSVGLNFIAPNAIKEVEISKRVFEKINGSIIFNEQISSREGIIVYNYTNSNVLKFKFNNNGNFTFMLPPSVPNGTYGLTIIIIDSNNIGFAKVNISLQRYASELITDDSLIIAQYGKANVNVTYRSLNNLEIESPKIVFDLNSTGIKDIKQTNCTNFELPAYYLNPGKYIINVTATSTTHATITKNIILEVYKSNISSHFNYQLNEDLRYDLNFGFSSDGFPVAFAPLKLIIDKDNEYTGITDDQGRYSTRVILPLNLSLIKVNYQLINMNNIILNGTYNITNSIIKAETELTSATEINSSLSLSYAIRYPTNGTNWLIRIDSMMEPITNIFIDTNMYTIPVKVSDNNIYWHVTADPSLTTHKLIVITSGPNMTMTYNKTDNAVKLSITLYSESKRFDNLTIIEFWKEAININQYTWQLVDKYGKKISNTIKINEINEQYIKINGVDLLSGTYFSFNVIGTAIKNNETASSTIWVALTSGSTILVTASTFVIKLYKKKKSLTIDI